MEKISIFFAFLIFMALPKIFYEIEKKSSEIASTFNSILKQLFTTQTITMNERNRVSGENHDVIMLKK